jgi:hypothetical protein
MSQTKEPRATDARHAEGMILFPTGEPKEPLAPMISRGVTCGSRRACIAKNLENTRLLNGFGSLLLAPFSIFAVELGDESRDS